MLLLSKVDFSFHNILFVFGLIKKDYKTIHAELHKIKEDLKNDCYVKEEALLVLKFYNGRKWKGTGKELTETWDEFYSEYQKSKSK